MGTAVPTRHVPASDHTFLFADLAGFTALTEAHGDDAAAELAGSFCADVRELLPADQAEAVKTIGDAVLVRTVRARTAVEVALRIVGEVGARHGLPSVRVGMHTGPAVSRDGDWYGATVNTAARVAALARGDEILVTGSTLRALDGLDGVGIEAAGTHRLKNVGEPVKLYRLEREGPGAHRTAPIDPVCRMRVDVSRAAGSLRHAGAEFHFCSMECARVFTAAPERYVQGDRDPSAPAQARPAAGPRLARALAVAQGASYLYFGLWSLVRREHYREVHALRSDDWVLNAHGGWLLAVGGVLVRGGARPASRDRSLPLLGMASAVALAANDALLVGRIAPIYRLDLAYEISLAALWAAAGRAP